jgi:hypothetical protein
MTFEVPMQTFQVREKVEKHLKFPTFQILIPQVKNN